jgi:hypothetical protein
MRIRTLVTTPVLMAMLLAAGGCGDSTGPSEQGEDVREFITALATVTGGTATFRAGAAPSGGSGPAVTVSGTSAMITGGSTIRTVSSTSAFTRIIVAVDGVSGYWELTLPSAVLTEAIVLSLGQDIPQSNFSVRYAGGTSGAVGTFQNENVNIVTVGTGPVQVSVSWNSNADVDLYLIEPGGAEIYYGRTTSPAGGVLDLDSNAGCSTGPRNENITYNTSPPRGTYTVRVNYWSACGAASTQYVVTVRVMGQATRTFNGTFTGEGNFGGSGAGTVITTFNY